MKNNNNNKNFIINIEILENHEFEKVVNMTSKSQIFTNKLYVDLFTINLFCCTIFISMSSLLFIYLQASPKIISKDSKYQT